jgi:hypothetical protein
MWVDMIAQDLLAAGKKESVSWPCSNLHEALKVLSFKQKPVELTTSSTIVPETAVYSGNATGFASALVK